MVVRSPWRGGPLHFLLLHFTYCHYMHSETASSSSASYGVEISTFFFFFGCLLDTDERREEGGELHKKKKKEKRRESEKDKGRESDDTRWERGITGRHFLLRFCFCNRSGFVRKHIIFFFGRFGKTALRRAPLDSRM